MIEFDPVMVWNRIDGSLVSPMEMLQIDADGNEVPEASWKMSFLDTMLLCVGIAVRAERILQWKTRHAMAACSQMLLFR